MATNNEEIIERKEGSPVATSCLIIACVAILGAITLQVAELTQANGQLGFVFNPVELTCGQVLHDPLTHCINCSGRLNSVHSIHGVDLKWGIHRE